MFLFSPFEIALLILGLIVFAIFSWKRLNWGIFLVALCLPLYLLRFKIFWVPTTALELMIYILFIIWIIKKGFRGMRGDLKGLKKVAFPVLLLLAGVTISTIFSSDILTSAGIWKGWFLDPLLFFAVVVSLIKTKKQIKNLLSTLILSGAIVAAIGLIYWAGGNLTFDGRLRAFFGSPNHLAMYLAPILILGLGLWIMVKKRLSRVLLFIVNCLLFVVIYLTYSYGAWLGLLGTVIFGLGINYLRSKRRRISPFLLFAFLLLLLFVSQFGSEKFQNLISFDRSSFQSRLMIWQAGWKILKDYPLLGIGPGMFQKYYLDYQSQFSQPYLEWAVPQPHNLYLAFWLQTGLLGFIGFIWLLVWFFHPAGGQPQADKLRILIMSVMVYILVHGLVDTTYWKNDLSIIFWIVIGLMAVLTKKS